MAKDKPLKPHGFTTFILFIVFVFTVLVLGPYFIINQYHSYVLPKQHLSTALSGQAGTAIILGSGVRPDGSPGTVLQERLVAGAELHEQGIVDEVIVSGYGPDESYDEPAAMKAYLLELGLDSDSITEDNSGHDTMATCRSARKNFELEQAVLVSQPGHLDRAIYLCRAEGVEAYGYDAGVSSSLGAQMFQSVREAGSNIKAVFEVSAAKLGVEY